MKTITKIGYFIESIFPNISTVFASGALFSLLYLAFTIIFYDEFGIELPIIEAGINAGLATFFIGWMLFSFFILFILFIIVIIEEKKEEKK